MLCLFWLLILVFSLGEGRGGYLKFGVENSCLYISQATDAN